MNHYQKPQMPQPQIAPQLLDTREAFDSVAADYDGPRGNNAQIQEMRLEMWRWLDRVFPKSSRLLDLGCGTGLDAVRMASLGHQVTGSDWSPLMVQRTKERASENNAADRVRTVDIGAHELQRLPDSDGYDGIYSNLGPLNCVPNLTDVSRECARLLKPGGLLVFTVIGRMCPWEIAHYVRLRRWARAKLRFARGVVPVAMNNHTIWTRYYAPREFYAGFRPAFELKHFRGVCTFAPPPYLTSVKQRFPRLHAALWGIDRRTAGWPLLRGMGDHFLMILRKR